MLIILILALSRCVCLSQEVDHFKEYGLFFNHNCEIEYSNQTKIGKKSYVYGNNVNLRSDSSLNSDVVETLNQGESIEVLYSTRNYAYKIKEHGEPWLKIKTKQGKIGFVYGALIAKNYLNYDLNKNGVKELILLGNDFLNPPNATIKIFEKGKLIVVKKIESLCIDTHCESLVMLRIIKDTKLSNKEIIEAGTGSNYCRASWTSNFLCFQNDDLEILFSEHLGYGKNTRILFPSDKGGVKNHIIVEKDVQSGNSFKRICNVKRSFRLENETIRDIGFDLDLKDDLVRVDIEVGDTLNTNQFYNNVRNKNIIKPLQLEKILSVDNGIFIIDESKNTLLLGDYTNEGESIELNVLVFDKQDYTIKTEQRIAKESAWEHGYINMFSIYKGEFLFDIIKTSGNKDFGDYSEWKRDTTVTHFQIN